MKVNNNNFQAEFKQCQSELIKTIYQVLTGSEFIGGKAVEEFEETFADYVQAEHCAGVSNGSSALILALKAAGVGPGHEVIMPTYTFIATAEAVVNVGAVPVFVDTDDSYLINIDYIEPLINANTKAIIAVDLFGQTPDLNSLIALSRKHKLIFIEDAAQACGSYYRKHRVGSIADLTCFSFNPYKNLAAPGDAGAVTGQKEFIDRVKMLRDHGRYGGTSTNFNKPEEIGYGARMDSLHAKILQVKLPYLDQWNRNARSVAERYTKALSRKPEIVTPYEHEHSYHTYHQYVIRHDARDTMRDILKKDDIMTNIHYLYPCHTGIPYTMYKADCPRAELFATKVLSLPCHHTMTDEEVEYVIEKITF